MLSVEDKLNYLKHLIPVTLVPANGQQVPRRLLLLILHGSKNYNMHDMGKNVKELYAMLKLHEQMLSKKAIAPTLHAIRCRLGQITKKRIEKLQRDRLINSTYIQSFDKCVSYMSGKMA
nr:zinc finger, CCHC-type [Tanacetum cinerariifolium]